MDGRRRANDSSIVGGIFGTDPLPANKRPVQFADRGAYEWSPVQDFVMNSQHVTSQQHARESPPGGRAQGRQRAASPTGDAFLSRLEEVEAAELAPIPTPQEFAGGYRRMPSEPVASHTGTRVGYQTAATSSSIIFGDDSPPQRGPARTTNQVAHAEFVQSYNNAKTLEHRRRQQEARSALEAQLEQERRIDAFMRQQQEARRQVAQARAQETPAQARQRELAQLRQHRDQPLAARSGRRVQLPPDAPQPAMPRRY